MKTSVLIFLLIGGCAAPRSGAAPPPPPTLASTPGAPSPLLTAEIARRLGVTPGPNAVLVISEKEQLKGALDAAGVRIVTRHGTRPFDAADAALIEGGDGVGTPHRVHLRSGEVWVGEVSADRWIFTTASGLAVPLEAEKVTCLVLPPGPETPPPPGTAWLTTRAGFRLLLETGGPGAAAEAVTAWGDLKIPLDDLVRLSRDTAGGYRAEFVDGSSLRVFLRGTGLAARTRSFGLIMVPPAEVVALERAGDAAEADDGPRVELVGAQAIGGRLAAVEISLSSGGVRRRIPASAILALERTAGERRFRVVPWEGETFDAEIAGGAVSVAWQGETMEIPVEDVTAVRNPLPPGPLQRRLDDLVAALGDPEWAQRDRAQKEIEKMGERFLAAIERARSASSDPEIRQRLGEVIENLDWKDPGFLDRFVVRGRAANGAATEFLKDVPPEAAARFARIARTCDTTGPVAGRRGIAPWLYVENAEVPRILVEGTKKYYPIHGTWQHQGGGGWTAVDENGGRIAGPEIRMPHLSTKVDYYVLELPPGPAP